MLEKINNWATGNGMYHTLLSCLGGDSTLAFTVIGLGIVVATGYLVIAFAWLRVSHQIKDVGARKSMTKLMLIFLFCAFCGYLWHPIQYFWPGWNVYVWFLTALAFVTWWFILDRHSLQNIAKYFEDKERMRQELDEIQDGIDKINKD